MYRKPAAGWAHATPTAILTPRATAGGGAFGTSAAISGNAIAIGDAGPIGGGGSVDVFARPVPGWRDATPTATLTGRTDTANNQLGQRIAISGPTIVASVRLHSAHPNNDRSDLYVYTRPRAGWKNATQTATLSARDSGEANDLGESLAITGTTIIAGAPHHSTATTNETGGVYTFTRPAHGWHDSTQTQEITADHPLANGGFGYAVAASGNTAIIGAPDDTGKTGLAYVLTRP